MSCYVPQAVNRKPTVTAETSDPIREIVDRDFITIERQAELATLSRDVITDPVEKRAVAVACGKFRAGSDEYRGCRDGYLVGYGARRGHEIQGADTSGWWLGFLFGFGMGDFAFRRDNRERGRIYPEEVGR